MRMYYDEDVKKFEVQHFDFSLYDTKILDVGDKVCIPPLVTPSDKFNKFYEKFVAGQFPTPFLLTDEEKKIIKDFTKESGPLKLYMIELVDGTVLKIYPKGKKVDALGKRVEVFITFERIDGEFNCEEMHTHSWFVNIKEMAHRLPIFMNKEKIILDTQVSVLQNFLIRNIKEDDL